MAEADDIHLPSLSFKEDEVEEEPISPINIASKLYISDWSDAQKLELTHSIREKNGHRPADGEFKRTWKSILDMLANSPVKILFENCVLPTWIGLHREYKELKFEVIKKYDIDFSDVSATSYPSFICTILLTYYTLLCISNTDINTSDKAIREVPGWPMRPSVGAGHRRDGERALYSILCGKSLRAHMYTSITHHLARLLYYRTNKRSLALKRGRSG